jgi:hypothetical protein
MQVGHTIITLFAPGLATKKQALNAPLNGLR